MKRTDEMTRGQITRRKDDVVGAGVKRGVVVAERADEEHKGVLEYLGRQPIMYWVLMFVIVKIPIELYAVSAGLELPLEIGWANAVMVAALCVPLLYLISLGIGLAARKRQSIF